MKMSQYARHYLGRDTFDNGMFITEYCNGTAHLEVMPQIGGIDSWKVDRCDGRCKREWEVPEHMLADVNAFLADGKPRRGMGQPADSVP